MWPFDLFEKPKTKEERRQEAFYYISDMIAASVRNRLPYHARNVMKGVMDLYKADDITEDGKEEVKKLLYQFTDHCEIDGWTRNDAYQEVKRFLAIMCPPSVNAAPSPDKI